MPPPAQGKRNNKTLSHLYKSSLPSLTELFPDWSQDDLIFVMDECQGDLHVAIARISEGHASQWGQVKSKKPKPKKPTIKPDTPRAAKQNNNKPRKQPQKKIVQVQQDEEPPKPSWASILRGPVVKEEEIIPPVELPTPNIPKTSPHPIASKTPTDITEPTLHTETITHTEPTPTKEPTEPLTEPIVEPTVEIAVETIVQPIVEPTIVETVEEPVVVPNVEEEEKEKEEEIKLPEPAKQEEIVVIKKEEPVEEVITIRKPTIRRLHQTEPVVLPANQAVASLSSVNVQFGSLNLSNGEERPVEKEVEKEEVVVVTKEEIVTEKKKEPVQPTTTHVQVQMPMAEQPQQQQVTAGMVGHKPEYTMNPYHNGYNAMMPAEYNMYNSMEPRMNYYDPSVYGQSPSMGSTHLFPRDKYMSQVETGYYYYQPQPAPPPPQQGYPATHAPPQAPHQQQAPPPPPSSSGLGYSYVNKAMYPMYKPNNEYQAYEDIHHGHGSSNMMPFDKPPYYMKPMMDVYYQPQQQQQQQQQQYYNQPPYYPQPSRQQQQPYWHQA